MEIKAYFYVFFYNDLNLHFISIVNIKKRRRLTSLFQPLHHFHFSKSWFLHLNHLFPCTILALFIVVESFNEKVEIYIEKTDTKKCLKIYKTMLHCVTVRGFRWNSKYKPDDGVILETSNIDVCEFNTHVWTSATSTSVTFNVWINDLVDKSSDILVVIGKLAITGGCNNNVILAHIIL